MKILYGALPLLLLAAAAQADDTLLVGGAQAGGGHSSYSTAGLIAPLPGSHFGDGWIGRIFAEEVSYRYKSGARSIDGLGLGGNASVGYQWRIGDGWVGLYGGPSYMHTDLSPDDHGSNARGGRFNARLQAEGEYNVTKDFKINGNGSYEPFHSQPHWTRLRTLYRLGGNIYMGPEAAYQGDADYKAWSAGVALVGIPITDKASIGLSAGLHKTDGLRTAAYGGLEFGVGF